MLQSPRIVQADSKLHVVLSSPRVYLLILAAGMFGLCGCDPVRTTSHSVVLTVMDDHGLPVPDVKVSIKESWESWQSWEPGGVAESQKAFFQERWGSDFVPWLKGVSDASGSAAIQTEITALDGTRGDEPPPNRDVVSNREYIIKLEGQNVQEEMRVVMKPGTSVKGKSYTVTIIDIQKPRYVDTHR
jgi:hypothetical protein